MQVSRGIDLVYGGGGIGLMGLVSQAVHRGGRRVVGYVHASLINQLTFSSILGQCPCVATGTYNISINYICTYVLYNYKIEDDI
jgi:predicted Rossmann-fold nucleotide-binding protein